MRLVHALLPTLLLSTLPPALLGCEENHFALTLAGGSAGDAGVGGAGGAGGTSGTGGLGGQGGSGGQASAGGQGGHGGTDPTLHGAPTPNTTPADLDIDVFGKDDNRYFFAIDAAQVAKMNQKQGGGDIYTPGGSDKPYADHLFATTARTSSPTAASSPRRRSPTSASTWRSSRTA
jgi:hypothetical protein